MFIIIPDKIDVPKNKYNTAQNPLTIKLIEKYNTALYPIEQ